MEPIEKLFENYLPSNPEKQAMVLKTDAEKVAQLLGEDGTSKHQIRKHYHRLLNVKQELVADSGADIKRFYPEIAMTAAYATYDGSRGKIGENFEKFLKRFTKESLKGDRKRFFELMTLFEAIVGYANKYVKKN